MGYLILSGLPASGKSTLARALAPALALPILDKDDILERLFIDHGTGGAAWRNRLSRVADRRLGRLAHAAGAAILVSWWRHPTSASASGTPTGWLTKLPGNVIEIYCACPPERAARRFVDRKRHAGHLDGSRNLEELTAEFERHAMAGALGVGPLVTVPTGGAVDVEAVLAAVRMVDGRS